MKRNFTVLSGLIAALVVVLSINLLASVGLKTAKIDLTEEKLYTLSDGSKEMLKKVEDEVRLKLFYSKRVANAMPGIKQYADRVVELLNQYDNSSDQISLEILEPRPDTEIEEAAIKYGIRGAQIRGQELFYFGLAIENEIGESESIPFLDPSRESYLEYDISRLIAAVSNPEKKTIGIMSALPVMGGFGSDPMARFSGRPESPAWIFTQELQNNFEVKEVPLTATEVEPDIDLLIVVHPKGIKPESEYAIDQFLMRGGRLIAMVDPLSIVDMMSFSSPNPQDRFQASYDSNLPTLLPAWGLEMVPNKIAGDMSLATTLAMNRGEGPSPYPNFLSMKEPNLNQDEIVTANLENVLLANAGILNKKDDAPYEMTPLIETSSSAGEMDAFLLKFGADADSIRKELKSPNQKLTLGWRITGKLKTAFPAGKPAPSTPPNPQQPPPADPAPHAAEATEPTSIVVIADADMMADELSVQKQQFLNQVLAMMINDNLNLVNNAVENLLGATELISLRTRGRSTRPFTLVDEIEREAQAKWKAEEDQLNAQLEETRQRIQALQAGRGESQAGTVLSATQLAEIEKFREQERETKKRLIEVRRNLRQDIEALGTRLKLVNIALVPGIIFLLSFLPVAWRSFRMRSSS